MSNYSEDNTFNRERERALRNNNLDLASNKLENLNQQRDQKVPTPEPRRRLGQATTTAPISYRLNPIRVRHDNERLGNELALDQEGQRAARLVRAEQTSHQSQFYNSNDIPIVTRRTVGGDRQAGATTTTSVANACRQASPVGTTADEAVRDPTTNVDFDGEDEIASDTDDEDRIRLAEGDDYELVDEYYGQSKSPLVGQGMSAGHPAHDQLTNLARQSMVPVHELIAYYQYIQTGDPLQPPSLERPEAAVAANTNATGTSTPSSSATSATTSRQSSSASHQTSGAQLESSSRDVADASGGEATRVCQVVGHPGGVAASSQNDDLQTSDCQSPVIVVDKPEVSYAPTANEQQQQQSSLVEQPKVQDRTRLRANVVLELINSERDFVKHLKNVVEGYLYRARKHPEIFTAQQISTIFANIEQLYEFQRKFLEDLERCINWSDLAQSQVGHCFLRYEKGFSVYHYYCNNHPNATSELQDLFSKSVFRAFFEECRLKQNMIDISLDGFLLTPIQKICKYPLQLNELLKNTSEHHSDYADVANALETMRNCANLANERKRRIEALADVMSFQEKFDNWFGVKLSDTCSILVHSGEVSKMTSHTWSQGVQLHLFDHLLLYSKRDLLKRNSLILKGRICMDTVTEISDADEYKPRKSFKLYCKEQEKWVVFTTKSEREKDEWIRAFERERNLVDADEAEGFRITDRELGIARRTLLHRKRSRSARYRHHHNASGTGGGAGSKRPDTAVTDQPDLDDSNLMINRTLSLPSCIHPSHVMNFVEDSRVLSSGHQSNSSTRKKNASPNSNSRGSPIASSQHLAGGSVQSETLPGEQSASHGPTNWLRKMGSKKLTKAQAYQINGQTGPQQQQAAQQVFTSTAASADRAADAVAAQDVDAAALKYDELEKRHRDHMVSEQQARLYRLNNDLPPPPTLYPARSLTPTPRSGGGPDHGPPSQNLISSSNNNNRPKSSPSQHGLRHAGISPPPHLNTNLESAPRSITFQRNGSSSWSTGELSRGPLESQFKKSLNLDNSNASRQQQQQHRTIASRSPSQATFETKLVLSSGRVVHVREDAV